MITLAILVMAALGVALVKLLTRFPPGAERISS
jgi:hypothetical protein